LALGYLHGKVYYTALQYCKMSAGPPTLSSTTSDVFFSHLCLSLGLE
jgi:hypothetical protein